MWFHPLTATAPAELLGWEGALLDAAEAQGMETLWCWEAPAPFVVVGYGQQITREVDESTCIRRGVPILRRGSGGGAVVQGPGCLNYGLALRIEEGGPLASITSANQWIMERNRRALATLLGDGVVVRGHTDLALATVAGERKFSGNAQRRRRNTLLFHGTILLHFDLDLMGELLRFPSAQPNYRARRSHLDFVTNTGLTAAAVIAAWRKEWQAGAPLPPPTVAELRRVVADRYGQPDGHWSR